MNSTIQLNGKEIDVQQYRNDWALALMSRGIVVKLAISRWRPFSPLNEEDLGLIHHDNHGNEFVKNYIKLGTEKLLPPAVINEIEHIEQRARKTLMDHSFVTVWGRFVPYTAFENWEKENTEIKKDYMDAAKRLWERYDDLIAMVRSDYRNMAKDVWARIHHNQGEATESFIENFISNVIAKIPNKSEIFESFKYEQTLFIIPMPSMIEQNLLKAQQIKQERELKVVENQLEKESKRRVAEEYVMRRQELIDKFLESTVTTMRGYVADLCDKVLQSVTRNGNVKDMAKSQREKIKKMIRKVSVLNFHNDKQITDLLKELEMEIDKFKGDRDKNVVVNKLQEIVDFAKQEFIPTDFNPSIGSLEV